MGKLKMYVAVSLDGKIAKPDGTVGWLDSVPHEESHYGYEDFIEDIDVTVMGNNTFTSVDGASHGDIYPGKENYIFTRNKELKDTPYFKYITEDPVEFTRKKLDEGKNVWVVGGGVIHRMLYNAGLVDEIWLHVMPLVLGDGIGLFDQATMEDHLTLVETKSYSNGVVLLKYQNS